jgi:hypothetical protein
VSHYEFDLKPIDDMKKLPGEVSRQWDDALARLKDLAER